MANQNSINTDITNNADGLQIGGGIVKRILKWLGADITLTGSGTNVYTFPAATDTLVGRDSTDTLTNKTLASGTIGVTQSAGDSTTKLATTAFVTTADNLKANIASPTFTGTVGGITASMVGLSNVDNTSDATKNSASVALTNKDLTSATNTFPSGLVTIGKALAISSTNYQF